MRHTITAAIIAAAIAATIASHPAAAKQHRSHQAIAEFKRANPCPATGKPRGACPGWVVDHVNPLACGGPDRPGNMQWQTTADAKAKDKWERRSCGR